MAQKITDEETKILTDFFKGSKELTLEAKETLLLIYNKYFGNANVGDNQSEWRHFVDNLSTLVKLKKDEKAI